MPEFKGYEPVLSSKATAFLAGQSKRKQHALIELFQRLSEHPSQIGDYTEEDDTGRFVQYLLVGDYVIGFWTDDAVKEFRIVDIDEI